MSSASSPIVTGIAFRLCKRPARMAGSVEPSDERSSLCRPYRWGTAEGGEPGDGVAELTVCGAVRRVREQRESDQEHLHDERAEKQPRQAGVNATGELSHRLVPPFGRRYGR